MHGKRIEIIYNPLEPFALTRIEGCLTVQEFIETISILKKTKTRLPGVKDIWDLSFADLSRMDVDKVQEVLEYATENQIQNNSTNLALVTVRDINLPILQLYKFLAKGLNMEVRVFNSVFRAKSWLESIHESTIDSVEIEC